MLNPIPVGSGLRLTSFIGFHRYKIMYSYIYIVISIDVIIIFFKLYTNVDLFIHGGCFEPYFHNGVHVMF